MISRCPEGRAVPALHDFCVTAKGGVTVDLIKHSFERGSGGAVAYEWHAFEPLAGSKRFTICGGGVRLSYAQPYEITPSIACDMAERAGWKIAQRLK